MRSLFTLLLILFAMQLSAQELVGKVLDEKKEPVVNAWVCIYKEGVVVAITITDYDGYYSIKLLEPGCYDVKIKFPGCDIANVLDVVLMGIEQRVVNVNMQHAKGRAKSTCIIYKMPLANPDESVYVLPVCRFGPDKEDTMIQDLVAQSPGIYQKPRENVACGEGGRSSGNLYIVDGVQPPQTHSIYRDVEKAYNPSQILTAKQIHNMPYTRIVDVVAALTGCYQRRLGDDLHFYGSR